MRVLVTGGNGYVGRTLCRLLRHDHTVGIIDNLRYGDCRFEREEVAAYQWFQEDIRNRAAMKDIVDRFQPDAIVHLAAIHFIPECEGDPELAVSTNVQGTVNLASVCPANCRFVFASSGAVYAPEVNPHDELRSPTRPSDVYGWTKLHGEDFLSYFARQRKFSAAIVRLFNVVGPGETNPHVLPEIIAQLKAGRTTIKLGNLDAKRDYVHVQDVARGFASVACSGTIAAGETVKVNLGTQASYSVAELLKMLKEVSSVPFDVEADPTRMRPSDRPHLAANRAQIQQQFGWQPKLTIRHALEQLWEEPDLPLSLIERYR